MNKSIKCRKLGYKVWLSGLFCAIIRADLLTFHFIPEKFGVNNRVVWLSMVWLSGLYCTSSQPRNAIFSLLHSLVVKALDFGARGPRLESRLKHLYTGARSHLTSWLMSYIYILHKMRTYPVSQTPPPLYALTCFFRYPTIACVRSLWMPPTCCAGGN